MYAEEYFPYEYEDGDEGEWIDADEGYELVYVRDPRLPLHHLPDFTLPVGIAAMLVLVFALTRGGPDAGMLQPVIAAAAGQSEALPAAPGESLLSVPEEPPDPNAFAAPYEDYVITQGVHGASYGHMAIDLAAGQGAAILSPIHGVIAANFTDKHGNPTLVIENDRYIVTLLHGLYTPDAGETVALGEKVGEESNLGYTTDMRGVPCWQKTGTCGYHTHLNVFDKAIEANVNPLDLIR